MGYHEGHVEGHINAQTHTLPTTPNIFSAFKGQQQQLQSSTKQINHANINQPTYTRGEDVCAASALLLLLPPLHISAMQKETVLLIKLINYVLPPDTSINPTRKTHNRQKLIKNHK